jgi:hypothetical protein
MWLKSAAPDLFDGLQKLENEDLLRTPLQLTFESSGRAIAALLERAFAGGGKIKGFKPHARAFLGYLIAHEAHHRSDRAHAQTGGASGGQEDRIWSVGMGRAMMRPGRQTWTRT